MPGKRIKASDLTEHRRELIRSAEEIWLVDPRPELGQDSKHAWMEMIISVPPAVPDVVDPSAPQPDPLILEIEVDSTNLEELVRVRELVKRLSGEPTIEAPHSTGSV